ncbi:hypothetical protein F4774DRAFT_335598 [Daldinia eschscholtzii]|nr:hypothetical protein F4774DRAFT_335598 [Daldinia eschscholtzii]
MLKASAGMDTGYIVPTTLSEVRQLFPGIERHGVLMFPEEPPKCRRCKTRPILQSNDTDNSIRRPYYSCIKPRCGHFRMYADHRGNDPTNPKCSCGSPSRRMIAGHWRSYEEEYPSNIGHVYYTCRFGDCTYKELHKTPEGHYVIINDWGLVDALEKLYIV